MKKVSWIIVILWIISISPISAAAQKPVFGKVLDDGWKGFVDGYTGVAESGSGAQEKLDALEPFVMGYFGFKALRFVNLGVGGVEAGHLRICKALIGMYDGELNESLETIASKPTGALDSYFPTDNEKQVVQRFVVVKQNNRFGSFAELAAGRVIEKDARSYWQWQAGMNLGETAGDVVLWYKFPNYKPFDLNISERLGSLDKLLSEAPAGIPSDFIQNARRLSAFKNRTFYSPTEREQIAAELGRVVRSAIAFANAGKGFPKATTAQPKPSPRPVVRPTPAPTPIVRPTPAPTPIVRPTPSPNRPPGSTAKTNLADGRRLADQGLFNQAIARYTDAARQDPQNGEIYFYRSIAYSNLKLTDKAIDDINTAIMLETFLPDSYYNRGTYYIDKKSYAAAKADLDRSLELRPVNQKAYYNRGIAKYNLAEYKSASDDFTRSIALNPQHMNSFIMRANSYCKQKLLMSAILDQEEAIKLGAKITKGCSQ